MGSHGGVPWDPDKSQKRTNPGENSCQILILGPVEQRLKASGGRSGPSCDGVWKPLSGVLDGHGGVLDASWALLEAS